MIEFSYTLTIDEGLHARPAGNLVKKIQGYAEKVTITKNGKTIDGKRLFPILNLQVKKGEQIVIAVEGGNEETVAKELKSYCESML